MSINRNNTPFFLTGVMAVLLAFPVVSAATIVRMQTAMGVIDVRLFDSAAPLTAANFLNYVDSGAYNNTFIHRSVPGFIIQGGGFVWDEALKTPVPIATNPSVMNEFSPDRSNVRGTIAMAKLGNDPNSATNQWFFNLVDNSRNLDSQNGGFTVFGQVIEQSMQVVDAIAALPTYSIGGAFTSMPVQELSPGNLLLTEIISVTSNHGMIESDSDRLFAYLEAAYPEYVAPANPFPPANIVSPASSVSATAEGYYYRYYPATDSYVGTANGQLYYLGAAFGNQIIDLGPLSEWVATAIAAGY
ncbi:MAG: peptidylprolyl isomerase [Methylobacter sp.]